MTVCIQCAMRMMIDSIPMEAFDETPEEHQRRVHPNLKATKAERADLEAKLAAKMMGGAKK